MSPPDQLMSVERQLAVVTGKLERDDVSEEVEFVLRKEKVALFQDKYRLEDRFSPFPGLLHDSMPI